MANKTWCFTLNNWTEEEYAAAQALEHTRLVIGKEVGENGTPHLQGAVTFPRAHRLTGVKKLLARAHWEPARSAAAFDYCMKDGDFIESDKRAPGTRTDIARAVDMVLEGADVFEIGKEIKSYQAVRMAEIMIRCMPFKSEAIQREVLWYYGPSGTGKSRTAREEHPDLYLKESYKWWDGYTNQETVLIDDMRGDFCKFHELLRMIDIYTYRGEVKGGSVPIRAKRFIITSCYNPEQMYGGRTDEELVQLTRRISRVRYFPREVTVTEVGGNTIPLPRLQADVSNLREIPPSAAERALTSALARWSDEKKECI